MDPWDRQVDRAQGPQSCSFSRRPARAKEEREALAPVLELLVVVWEVVVGVEEISVVGFSVGTFEHSTFWKMTSPTVWFPVERNSQVELSMSEQPFSSTVLFSGSEAFVNVAIM